MAPASGYHYYDCTSATVEFRVDAWTTASTDFSYSEYQQEYTREEQQEKKARDKIVYKRPLRFALPSLALYFYKPTYTPLVNKPRTSMSMGQHRKEKRKKKKVNGRCNAFKEDGNRRDENFIY